ncbi:P-loop containing nucleoside triphosphate hydrolase protein [Rhexocercosporidium sp. MPI-PUGE-AT-0058]|nr:P-loop containing nucleoside triphosphate hydrolase protein [Rhexocercosporidium sp. MPI-PUGE-AT-0058]
MDYNSIHGPGHSNFSSPTAHRMPTVSAAQALQELKTSPARCISTGLSLLDCMLQIREPAFSDAEALFGGVSRGKVTEIYGPPGVGKTALGIQLAASALHAGEEVVWIDASHPISGSRLTQILTSHQPPSTSSLSSNPTTLSTLLSNLTHFSTPTLAHLLALLTHPTTSNPPPKTSLIVIDSFSTLISNAFPRSSDASNATPRKPGAPNPPSRKFPILQHLISSLSKVATTRNIAIVLTSQCVTKMRPGAGAVLIPAVNTTAWEQGLGCRVELMRDWGWEDEEGRAVEGVRLARVVKAEGVVVGGVRLVGFGIRETGLHPLTLPLTTTLPGHPSPQKRHQPPPTTSAAPTLPQKRKLSATDLDTPLEIPDSDAEDDEDYGWAEEDEEELPPPPPQWQGSEDALAPPVEEPEGDEELLELGLGKDYGDRDEGEDLDEDVRGEGRRIRKEVIDDSEDELAL